MDFERRLKKLGEIHLLVEVKPRGSHLPPSLVWYQNVCLVLPYVDVSKRSSCKTVIFYLMIAAIFNFEGFIYLFIC